MKLRNVALTLVFVLAGGALTLEIAARSAAASLVRALAPSATLTYDSAGVGLDGSIRLRSPRLEIGEGLSRSDAHARVVYLRGSGMFWLLGYLIPGETEFPATMSISARGLTLGQGNTPMAISDWLGTPDLALFENQGCGSDALTRKDRVRMGIPDSERDDRFEYRYDKASRQLDLNANLDSASIANWQGYLEFDTFDPARWADLGAQDDLRLSRAGLSYRDPGYLAKRNRFCAQWLGITAAQFVERHLAAVKTFFATRGIEPSAEVLALYARLVSTGGTLNLASLPDSGWIPAEFEAYPRQILLRQLNITARLEDAPPIMLRFGFAEPEAPISILASVPAGAESSPTISPIEDAPLSLPEPAPPAALTSSNKATPAPTPPPPLPASTAVASTTNSPAAEPKSAPVDSKTSPVSDASAAPTDRAQSRGREGVASSPPPPANSTLALVWRPGAIDRLPPKPTKARAYEVVPTASLGGYLGERVQLITVSGNSVDGQINEVDGTSVVLLVQVGRGSAELNVPLMNVKEARLMRTQQTPR